MPPNELLPAHARRVPTSQPQPRASRLHRRGGDANAKAFQLADDELVAPSRVVTGKAEH
jgi:hypothetical protein